MLKNARLRDAPAASVAGDVGPCGVDIALAILISRIFDLPSAIFLDREVSHVVHE